MDPDQLSSYYVDSEGRMCLQIWLEHAGLITYMVSGISDECAFHYEVVTK